MMIELTDTDRATRAAQWCKRLGIPYNLEFWGWPGKTRYRFIFPEQKHLALFTLRWV
jgi:hypothetical protein